MTLQQILPFLRENGNGAWQRMLNALGSKKAYELACLDRQEIITYLRVEKRWSLEAIARLFGLTRERIRQITPPGLWKELEVHELTEEELAPALRKAVYDKLAWHEHDGGNGRLSVVWLAEELGISDRMAYGFTLTKGKHKFDSILRYGLGLDTKDAMLEWMNQKYYREGMPYSAIARLISSRFISVSTMHVYRRMKALGFRGRSRGRMSEDDYMVDIQAQ